jgi:hypothetical protein
MLEKFISKKIEAISLLFLSFIKIPIIRTGKKELKIWE